MPFLVAGIATLLLGISPGSALAAKAWTSTPAIPGTMDVPFNGPVVDGALTSSGTFVSVWLERPPGGPDILKGGVPGTAGTELGRSAARPDVAADGVGGFWVTWTDYSDQSEFRVKVAHRSAAGAWTFENLGAGDGASVGAGADGTAAVLFQRTMPSRPKGEPAPEGAFGNVLRVRRAASAAFAAAVQSGLSTGSRRRVAVGGDGTVFVASNGSSDGGLQIARHLPDGTVLPATIAGGGEDTEIELVADAEGRAALAATHLGGSARVAVADTDQAFALAGPGPPTQKGAQLDTGDIRGRPAVAFGPGGQVVVAWNDGLELLSSTGSAEGGPFTDPAVIADRAFDYYIAAAYTPSGVPAVAYLSWDGTATQLARRDTGGVWSSELVHCPLPVAFPVGLSFTSAGSARLLSLRSSRAPLPGAMLSSDSEATEASPANCEPRESATVTPALAPPGVLRTVDLTPLVEEGEQLTFAFDPYALAGKDYMPQWEQVGPEPTFTFTPETAGAHLVEWQISDAAGAMGSSAVVFTSNPPEATLTATPETATVGDPVDLAVETTDIDPAPDTIVQWSWDLDGDGAYERDSASRITWSFGTPGEHTVRVRVRDRYNATAEARVTVSVREAEQEQEQQQDGDGITLPPPPEIEPLTSQEQRQSRPKPPAPPRVESPRVQELDTTLDRGLPVDVTPTVTGTASVRLLEGATGTTATASKVRVLATRTLKVRAGRRVRVRLRPGRAARTRLRRAGRAKLTVEVRVGGSVVRRAVRLR